VDQLKPLLEKLSLGWNTPDELTHGPPMFALDIKSTPSMSEASTVLDNDDVNEDRMMMMMTHML
jgi:hypothetical protein